MVVLAGCATTIEGTPLAAAEPPSTTSPTATTTTRTTPTPTPTTTTAPPAPVQLACDFANEAFPNVGLLVATVVFEETSGLFPVPSPGREDTAQVMDAVLIDTEPMLAALPAGPVEEAFAASRMQSAALRDALRAPPDGPLPDTVDDGLADAYQRLQAVCP